jgi:hypothetical protein
MSKVGLVMEKVASASRLFCALVVCLVGMKTMGAWTEAASATETSENATTQTGGAGDARHPEGQDDDASSIADAPLDATLRPKPASLMFVMDNSGSMDWEIVTASDDGLYDGKYYVFSYPNVTAARVYDDNSLEGAGIQDQWKSQWFHVNKMFYNPGVTYAPWPTFAGTPPSRLPAAAADGLAHANIYRPRLHPWHSQDCIAAVNWVNGASGANRATCLNVADNTHTFPMDDLFLQLSDPAKEKIADNTGAAFTGSWTAEASRGSYGDGFHRTNTNSADAASWTFTPEATTTYEIFAWWVEDTGADRLTNVPYTITCGDCTPAVAATVSVNQQISGSNWVKLGEFHFNDGKSVIVSLSDSSAKANSSCADAVKLVPKDSSVNIINAHYYTWDDQDRDGMVDFDDDVVANKQLDVNERVKDDIYLVNLTNPIEYYKIIDNAKAVSWSNLQRVDADQLPPTVKVYASPTDADAWRKERQNWADWFSYYRKRTLAATGAVAHVIDKIDNVEVGIRTVNYHGGGYEAGGFGVSQAVLPVNAAGEDKTSRLLQLLYGAQVQAYGTPLRNGLKSVGQYFDDTDDETGSIGLSPYHAREDGDECKQVFAVLTTDGYWNDDAEPGVGNADAGLGPPYQDSHSNTLADVAMTYFAKDLSPMENLAADGLCARQHMVTYTVAFGVHGSLDPADYDFNKGVYPVWPNPTAAERYKIDDLWHAAVNGRGRFLAASRPDELVESLRTIANDISGRVGSGASVSVNGDEMFASVDGKTRLFQTTYVSGDWHGDLKSYEINPANGAVLSSRPVWSAEDKLADRLTATGSGHASRIVATYNGTAGVPFRWENLTDIQRKQLAPDFIASTTSGLTGEHLVNYLRGDKTNESANSSVGFRPRAAAHPLGDFVHSSARYQDDMLYVGGNDGMLHALRATDASGGEEAFAYVPNLVLGAMRELANPAYKHKYYVDQTPDVRQVGDSTLLVGGLGKGGKGYYCLDVTDAKTAITSESELAARVRWEYPPPAKELLSGTTLSFTRAAGADGNDVIADSLNRFTAENRFVAGKTIAVVGAHCANGLLSETNDGLYKIAKVDPSGAFIEVPAGSVTSGCGSGRNVSITESSSDTGMGYSLSKAFFIQTNAPVGINGWVVVFGNGYESEDGTASLYMLNPANGEVLKKIDVKAGPLNGLSTPNAVDVNNDLKADYVYAGDLLGNVWKFDLSGTDPSLWQVAYCDHADATRHCQDTVSGMIPKPLFTGLSTQPITSAPDVMRHMSGLGHMVVFGTGKYLTMQDISSLDTQSLYGIWDWAPDAFDAGCHGARVDVGSGSSGFVTLSNWPEVNARGEATYTLLRQETWREGEISEDANGNGRLDAGEDVDGDGKLGSYSYYRIPSNYAGNWTLQKTSSLEPGHPLRNKDLNGDGVANAKDRAPTANLGWVFDLPGKIDLVKDHLDNDHDGLVDETGERLLGERVVNDAIIRDGRAVLISFGVTGTRCRVGTYSFLNERNAHTGGMLYAPAFDLNGDGAVNRDDYVSISVPYDANGDGRVDASDVAAGIPSDVAHEGMLCNPSILRGNESADDNRGERKYFSTSHGSVIVVDEKAEKRGVSYWQQIE